VRFWSARLIKVELPLHSGIGVVAEPGGSLRPRDLADIMPPLSNQVLRIAQCKPGEDTS